jgi:hypothetical protein
MDGRRHSKPFSPNWKLWCVMNSKHSKCAPVVRCRQSTWFGVVCKVRIEKFNRIPNMIELAKKTSKMDDRWKTHKQQLVEALACPCKHPSVIKFLTIHTKTMEAYTLWWKGGTLWEMLDYNTKYSPIIDNCTLLWQTMPNMERWTQLVAFRQNCVKLAWAFINIMNLVHHCGILHKQLVQEQHYVASFGRQTKCYVHRCVQLGWNWVLTRGDAIIVWFCKGTRCHQHKKKCIGGLP